MCFSLVACLIPDILQNHWKRKYMGTNNRRFLWKVAIVCRLKFNSLCFDFSNLLDRTLVISSGIEGNRILTTFNNFLIDLLGDVLDFVSKLRVFVTLTIKCPFWSLYASKKKRTFNGSNKEVEFRTKIKY